MQFHDRPFSDDPAHWGQAGDFIGGLLNPIVSLATLVITVYIAFLLKEHEEKQSNLQITTQRLLLAKEFKYAILKESTEKIFGVLDGIENKYFRRAAVTKKDCQSVHMLFVDYDSTIMAHFPELFKKGPIFKDVQPNYNMWSKHVDDPETSYEEFLAFTSVVRQRLFTDVNIVIQS
jgi:hypothetical protein